MKQYKNSSNSLDILLTSADPQATLNYFVEWRPYLWSPAVRMLLQSPERFQNQHVLDLGCRYGRMSVLFALLGAQVTAVDLSEEALQIAKKEATKWGVDHRIDFQCYDGNPENITAEPVDFVFSKSVLVIVPELSHFLEQLTKIMKPNGSLLLAENMEGPGWLRLVRKRFIHRKWSDFDVFQGVGPAFLETLSDQFTIKRQRTYYGLVLAIEAQRTETIE